MRWFYLIIVCLFLIATGCSGNRNKLIRTRWWPVQLKSENLLYRVFSPFPSISFQVQRNVVLIFGNGGCNSFSAGKTIGNRIIKENPDISGPQGLCVCLDREVVDQELQNVISNASTYEIVGDTLYLSDTSSRIGTFVEYHVNELLPGGPGD